jgi:hypothetical protein
MRVHLWGGETGVDASKQLLHRSLLWGSFELVEAGVEARGAEPQLRPLRNQLGGVFGPKFEVRRNSLSYIHERDEANLHHHAMA